jgi:hypothetical protein
MLLCYSLSGSIFLVYVEIFGLFGNIRTIVIVFIDNQVVHYTNVAEINISELPANETSRKNEGALELLLYHYGLTSF